MFKRQKVLIARLGLASPRTGRNTPGGNCRGNGRRCRACCSCTWWRARQPRLWPHGTWDSEIWPSDSKTVLQHHTNHGETLNKQGCSAELSYIYGRLYFCTRKYFRARIHCRSQHGTGARRFLASRATTRPPPWGCGGLCAHVVPKQFSVYYLSRYGTIQISGRWYRQPNVTIFHADNKTAAKP